MTSPKIFTVMANYNGFDVTYRAIVSLKQVDYDNNTIIVVDDCSVDDSYHKLLQIEDIIVLKTLKNSGLNTAFNVGIRYALENGADYVFLVQNDTDEFSKNIFKSMLSVFDQDSSIGLVGPVVIDKYRKPRWLESGKFIFDTHINTSEGYMVKRKVFEKIGMFNEELVVYFEDVDFIIRMRKAGFKTAKDNNSSFLHIGQATFSKQRFKPDYLRVRNIFMMMRRYSLHKGIVWNVRECYRLLKRHFHKMKLFIVNFRIVDFIVEFWAVFCGAIVGLFKPWDTSNEKTKKGNT